MSKTILQKFILVIFLLLPFNTPISVLLGKITKYSGISITIAVTITAILATLFFMTVLKSGINLKSLIRSNMLLMGITGYGLLLLVFLFFSGSGLGAYASFYHYVVPFLVLGATLILSICGVLDQKFLIQLLKIVIIGYAIVSVFSILQYFVLPRDILDSIGYGKAGIRSFQLVGVDQNSLRVLSTTAGPNSLGIYAAFMLPILVLARRLIVTDGYRKLITCLIALTPLVVYVSKSRTGLVGLVFAVFCILLMNRSYIHKKLSDNNLYHVFMIFVALVIISPLSLIYVNNGFGLNRGGSGVDTSDGQRLQSWDSAIQNILDTPIGHKLGTAGIGSFYRTVGPNIIENYYLQVGYEMGVIGLLYFLGLIYLIFREVSKIKDRYVKYCSLNLLGVVFLSCIFLPALSDELLATIPFVVLGLILGGNLRKQKTTTLPPV